MKATNLPAWARDLCNELIPEDVRTAESIDSWGLPHPPPPVGSACDKPTEHPGEDHAWRRAMRPAIKWPVNAALDEQARMDLGPLYGKTCSVMLLMKGVDCPNAAEFDTEAGLLCPEHLLKLLLDGRELDGVPSIAELQARV